MDQNQPQDQNQPTPAHQPAQAQPAGAQPSANQGGDNQRLKIDDNMLQQIGLGGLPPLEKNRLLAQIYETLELRVGMTLANQMTDAQLKEFETFISSNDESGALTWLESNFPNYKNVVAQELENLKNEVAQNAPAIIAAVNNPQPPMGYGQPGMAPGYPPQGGMPQQQYPYPPQGQPQGGMQPGGQMPQGYGQQPQPGQTYDPNQQ